MVLPSPLVPGEAPGPFLRGAGSRGWPAWRSRPGRRATRSTRPPAPGTPGPPPAGRLTDQNQPGHPQEQGQGGHGDADPAVLPEGDRHPLAPGVLDDDQVRHRAQDGQVPRQGAGHGQGQPGALLVRQGHGRDDRLEEQDGRDVAHQVRQDGRDQAQDHHGVLEDQGPALDPPPGNRLDVEGVDDHEQPGEHHQQVPVYLPVDLLRTDPAQEEEGRRPQGDQGDGHPGEEEGHGREGDRGTLPQQPAVGPPVRPGVMPGRFPDRRRSRRLPLPELPPEDQGNDQEIDDQPGRRHGSQVGREPPVGDVGQAADDHVLRVARDGGRRADVGGRRQADQVGHRVDPQAPGQVDHQLSSTLGS